MITNFWQESRAHNEVQKHLKVHELNVFFRSSLYKSQATTKNFTTFENNSYFVKTLLNLETSIKMIVLWKQTVFLVMKVVLDLQIF